MCGHISAGQSADEATRGRRVQAHEENVEARQTLVRELSVKHRIPGYEHELSDEEMAEFEDKMDEAIAAQKTKIDKLKVRVSC